jgi:hypothetical protein
MTIKHFLMTGLAFLALSGAAAGQVTPGTSDATKGGTQFTSESMTGEVVWVQGNFLVAKMQPHQNYAFFDVVPGREFMIDGQKKHIGDLKIGTMLTAVVVTRQTPVTVRTTSTLNGTVWWVQGNFVILTHENGENHEYQVPESYRFTVEGKPASVHELRKGMKVSATKIVEEPHTELSTEVIVSGKAPK